MRNSNVNAIYINGISSGSVLQIGDSNIISKTSAILSIQRPSPTFNGNEGQFENYPLFSRPISLPLITDSINMNIVNIGENIDVGVIKLIALSGDSVFHIGTTNRVHGNAKIHQVREYLSEKDAFGS